jgi:hypothetical protein
MWPQLPLRTVAGALPLLACRGVAGRKPLLPMPLLGPPLLLPVLLLVCMSALSRLSKSQVLLALVLRDAAPCVNRASSL